MNFRKRVAVAVFYKKCGSGPMHFRKPVALAVFFKKKFERYRDEFLKNLSLAR
jgi:hypothetical protein